MYWMCTGTDLPRCCFLSVELCFLKAILLCHPFVEVHWLCARPSQGGVLRSAFGSPTIAVWVCARLILSAGSMLICIQPSGGVNVLCCFIVLGTVQKEKCSGLQSWDPQWELAKILVPLEREKTGAGRRGTQVKGCRKVEREEYHFYFQHFISLALTWGMPKPRTCTLGKTQVAQGDEQEP